MKISSQALIWQELPEVSSTQDVASDWVRTGSTGDVVLTHFQSGGRGRLGRRWHADPGDSLAMTLILRNYSQHPKPYLLGMAIAAAVAGVCHAQLRWPNDIVIGEMKLGGILTEIIRGPDRQSIPVVGIGLNLNQTTFPEELRGIATSLHLANGGNYQAKVIAEKVLARMELLPEPNEWADIAPIWQLFDRTPGKRYRLPSGEEAVGVAIGSDGQLLCTVNGESRSILAAEAIFGSA